MKIHELKTDPEHFDAVWENRKTLEIRYNDRNYKTGDLLLLRKTLHTGKQMIEGLPLVYMNTKILCKISHIHKISHIQRAPGMTEGWVALSIKVLDRSFRHNE